MSQLKVVVALLVMSSCSRSITPVDARAADAPVDIPAIAPPVPPAPMMPPHRPLLPLADAPPCPDIGAPPPCVVEVVSFADPAQIGFRLCGEPRGVPAIAALAVDSETGIWGDVTKWVVRGWPYVEEMTDFNRGASIPWAVLATYDGFGGPISECETVGVPHRAGPSRAAAMAERARERK